MPPLEDDSCIVLEDSAYYSHFGQWALVVSGSQIWISAEQAYSNVAPTTLVSAKSKFSEMLSSESLIQSASSVEQSVSFIIQSRFRNVISSIYIYENTSAMLYRSVLLSSFVSPFYIFIIFLISFSTIILIRILSRKSRAHRQENMDKEQYSKSLTKGRTIDEIWLQDVPLAEHIRQKFDTMWMPAPAQPSIKLRESLAMISAETRYPTNSTYISPQQDNVALSPSWTISESSQPSSPETTPSSMLLNDETSSNTPEEDYFEVLQKAEASTEMETRCQEG